jgi:hypothetical protein
MAAVSIPERDDDSIDLRTYPKDGVGRAPALLGHLSNGNAFEGCNVGGYRYYVARFVALTTVGVWCQIRAVGLDTHAIEWHGFDHLVHAVVVFKRNRPTQ